METVLEWDIKVLVSSCFLIILPQHNYLKYNVFTCVIYIIMKMQNEIVLFILIS